MKDARQAITFNHRGRLYEVDPNSGVSLAIPLDFGGLQPNAYGVPAAGSEAFVAGDIVGDTRRGGSCNFEEYRFIPHCNGTHTECVGHITHARISVDECLRDLLVPAVVVSVEPVSGDAEDYASTTAADDLRITRHALESALKELDVPPDAALVMRTMPNGEDKLSRRYVEDIPPYYTNDALRLVVERGFRHLVCDLPSIDRLHDEGRLSNHRIFWNVEQGSFETNPETRMNSTITELAFVPNDIRDGLYALSLQIAAFKSDAAPSRPLLFKV